MDLLTDTIRSLRDIRNRVNGLRAAAKESPIRTLPKAVVKTRSKIAERLGKHDAVICRLGGVNEIEVGPTAQKPPEAASTVLSEAEVYVSLSGLADLSIERQRLEKELKETAGHIKRVRGKLSNEGFVAKAPPAVVEKERERLAELEDKLAALERNLAEISG
jgi:valyl-tRNA synthetase